jgi:SAM-dependent methyltransferase
VSDPAGLLFDGVAEDYDRFRPSYPDALVDEACATLAPGARVLEIGCGTGQLTTALVARGLGVEAVDPGPRMIELARRRAPGATFHPGRFEEVPFGAGSFAAVFSATAFHWVDPGVGWAKVARLLAPAGLLALLWLINELDDASMDAWRSVLPEAAGWVSRGEQDVLDGARERLDNVSELWSWLVKRDRARPEAADLFTDVGVHAASVDRVQTAEELLGEVGTSSAYLRLDAASRRRLDERLTALVDAAGGTQRKTTLVTLVTARTPA